jgi:hypothetical protein
VVKALPLTSGSYACAAGGDGFIVTSVASDEAENRSPSSGTRLHSYDARSGAEGEFELPGRHVCISRDLRRAACLCPEMRDGLVRRRLVLVNVGPGTQQTVLTCDDLPPLTTEEYVRVAPRGLWGPIPTAGWGSRIYADGLLLCPSEDLTQVVWVAQRAADWSMRYSLRHVDLSTGARRTIADEDEVPAMAAFAPYDAANSLSLHGITPDGKTCIYQIGARLVYADLHSGDRASVELPATQTGPVFSPSARRFIVTREDRWAVRERDVEWRVLEPGRSTPRYTTTGVEFLQWLDDDRLIISREGKLLLADCSGSVIRRLLPTSDSNP